LVRRRPILFFKCWSPKLINQHYSFACLGVPLREAQRKKTEFRSQNSRYLWFFSKFLPLKAAKAEHEYPGKAGLFWVRHEHFFERKRIEIANFITRSLPAGCYQCSWGGRNSEPRTGPPGRYRPLLDDPPGAGGCLLRQRSLVEASRKGTRRYAKGRI